VRRHKKFKGVDGSSVWFALEDVAAFAECNDPSLIDVYLACGRVLTIEMRADQMECDLWKERA
jgi:hypothetical protein